MLAPRGGGVSGAPSRAGLPRTLSQEALREVAASLTLMTNVTEGPSRCVVCSVSLCHPLLHSQTSAEHHMFSECTLGHSS